MFAHVKPRAENIAAACFVEAGPSLDKRHVSIFAPFSRAFMICLSCDSSMSLRPFQFGHTGRFCLSGNEVPASISALVSVVVHVLSYISEHMLANAHVPTRVYSDTFTTPFRDGT